MEFDAAGQEFRWMAIASKDPTMLSLCLPGEDPHSFMGSRIAPEWEYRALISAVKAGNKEAENVRKSGKVGNLSLQYRTRPPRFTSTARVDYGIDMNLKQGEHICRVYLNTYKGVPNYWNNQITNTKKSGYVETMAGRQVQVIGDWTGKMRWSMESTSINYPIQGTGAEQKYLAIACVKDYVLSIGGKFLLDMHDGLYWLIPDDKVKEAAIKIKNKLDNLPYKQAWGLVPPIPLPWDCKVGTSWGNLKDFQP
jgi:DNA polymerase-1